MEEKSLAFEMLQELKKTSKRWFIIAVIELVVIAALVFGFFVYDSQFEYADETYQYLEETELQNSNVNQSIGE